MDDPFDHSPDAHPIVRLSPAVQRMYRREAKRRALGKQEGMGLPPGYRDPFLEKDPLVGRETGKPSMDQQPMDQQPMDQQPMDQQPMDQQCAAHICKAQDQLGLEDALDSRPGTHAHIAEVRRIVGRAQIDLARRAITHDASKLAPPEVGHFDRAAFRLAGCAYGSDEYRAGLADLKPALDHHYAVNSHHPEHYADGIRGMSLLDLVEMACDWAAACQRSPGGDLRRSIELNQARFGYSDEVKSILLNTVPLLAEHGASA